MDETVSAADANRNFSRILRAVRDGSSFVVTSHGRPVARIVPASGNEQAMLKAREALFARLETQPLTQARPWTRDDLYDDDP